MRFILSVGSGPTGVHYKDSMMMAEEDAWAEIEEGLEEWLDENMPDRYIMECEFIPNDIMECAVILEFKNETDAMAFKLRWE